MTRPKYTSAFNFARKKRQESIAKHKRHQARLRMLAIAPKVFSSPELVGLILSHMTDKSALAHLSLVCKLWSRETARHLWDKCTQLLNLEYKVRSTRHARVASLIHHLHLNSVTQLWSGASPEMPELPNLRILDMNAAPWMIPFGSPYMSRLLSPSLRELRIVDDSYRRRPAFSIEGVRLNAASWLSSLHQSCPSLRSLVLDIRLTRAARTELELFFLSSSLQRLCLVDLLCEILDDWSVAIVLAQQSLRELYLSVSITTESLAILRKQCNGLPTLDNLIYLTATFNVSAERAMTSLFSCTPNLTVLEVTLDHTPDGTTWSPDATAFLAIGQLKHLYALHIRIRTSVVRQRQFTGITCSDLLVIADLPLTYLTIQPCRAEPHHSLFLCEVTGCDLLCVLRRWQSLKTLYLRMICEEVVCNVQQEQEIDHLLTDMNLQSLYIHELVITDATAVDPEIWLGSNSNFRPDPREWVPRRLYEPGALSDRVANDQQDLEDDLMVMGNAVEQEDGPNSEGGVMANDNEN